MWKLYSYDYTHLSQAQSVEEIQIIQSKDPVNIDIHTREIIHSLHVTCVILFSTNSKLRQHYGFRKVIFYLFSSWVMYKNLQEKHGFRTNGVVTCSGFYYKVFSCKTCQPNILPNICDLIASITKARHGLYVGRTMSLQVLFWSWNPRVRVKQPAVPPVGAGSSQLQLLSF